MKKRILTTLLALTLLALPASAYVICIEEQPLGGGPCSGICYFYDNATGKFQGEFSYTC